MYENSSYNCWKCFVSLWKYFEYNYVIVLHVRLKCKLSSSVASALKRFHVNLCCIKKLCFETWSFCDVKFSGIKLIALARWTFDKTNFPFAVQSNQVFVYFKSNFIQIILLHSQKRAKFLIHHNFLYYSAISIYFILYLYIHHVWGRKTISLHAFANDFNHSRPSQKVFGVNQSLNRNF